MQELDDQLVARYVSGLRYYSIGKLQMYAFSTYT